MFFIFCSRLPHVVWYIYLASNCDLHNLIYIYIYFEVYIYTHTAVESFVSFTVAVLFLVDLRLFMTPVSTENDKSPVAHA